MFDWAETFLQRAQKDVSQFRQRMANPLAARLDRCQSIDSRCWPLHAVAQGLLALPCENLSALKTFANLWARKSRHFGSKSNAEASRLSEEKVRQFFIQNHAPEICYRDMEHCRTGGHCSSVSLRFSIELDP